ncbi:MAG: hypothetical protein M3Y56_14190, partial [Armatimonadota bacterium]|nr:hypothetical protein [Armatimonadota bacterium]
MKSANGCVQVGQLSRVRLWAKRVGSSSTLWTMMALGAVFGPALAQNGGVPAPSSLTAIPGGGMPGYPNIELKWDSVSNAEGYSLHRALTADGVPGATALNGGYCSSPYYDGAVQHGVKYFYGVTATGATTSGFSNIVWAFAPPDLPTMYDPTPGSGSITLNWTGVTGATSYNINRSTTGYGGFTVLNTGVQGTTYTDPGLDPTQTYYYTVTAVISPGTSLPVVVDSIGAPSNSVSATPLAVTTPPAVPSIISHTYSVNAANTADITFTIGNVAGASYYKVYWAQGNSFADTQLLYDRVSPGQPNTPVLQQALALGTKYTYQVTAWNSAGESDKSAGVSITPQGPPGPLVNLKALPGDGLVTLTWDAANPAASQYNILRTPGVGSAPPLNVSTPGTSYPDTGLTNGVLYSYTVTPVNGNISGPPATATATPQAPAPGAINLKATGGDGQVTLDWSFSSGAINYT